MERILQQPSVRRGRRRSDSEVNADDIDGFRPSRSMHILRARPSFVSQSASSDDSEASSDDEAVVVDAGGRRVSDASVRSGSARLRAGDGRGRQSIATLPPGRLHVASSNSAFPDLSPVMEVADTRESRAASATAGAKPYQAAQASISAPRQGSTRAAVTAEAAMSLLLDGTQRFTHILGFGPADPTVAGSSRAVPSAASASAASAASGSSRIPRLPPPLRPSPHREFKHTVGDAKGVDKSAEDAVVRTIDRSSKKLPFSTFSSMESGSRDAVTKTTVATGVRRESPREPRDAQSAQPSHFVLAATGILEENEQPASSSSSLKSSANGKLVPSAQAPQAHGAGSFRPQRAETEVWGIERFLGDGIDDTSSLHHNRRVMDSSEHYRINTLATRSPDPVVTELSHGTAPAVGHHRMIANSDRGRRASISSSSLIRHSDSGAVRWDTTSLSDRRVPTSSTSNSATAVSVVPPAEPVMQHEPEGSISSMLSLPRHSLGLPLWKKYL
jgi:hypothetical protein